MIFSGDFATFSPQGIHSSPFPSSQGAFENGPQQSRARPHLARRKRTLDGEDRSERIEKQGKRRAAI
jgi:hypothetical protein